MVGLAGQLPIAGFAEGGSWSRRCIAEKLIEAGSGHQKQSMSGSSTGNSETAERRVELVELRCTGQRMDGDGEKVRLALIRVDG
jgi:hypothetical protein